MSIAQELLAEFEQQAPVTRRFLERLPDDSLAWKPHPRSLSAGQLAWHLATVPGNVAQTALESEVPPPAVTFIEPKSTSEVLEAFDQTIDTVRKVIPGFTDAAMNEPWKVVAGGRELFSLPKQALLRNIMLNHWYQHRGQFCVYLRLLNIPVPSSWGPSADEPV